MSQSTQCKTLARNITNNILKPYFESRDPRQQINFPIQILYDETTNPETHDVTIIDDGSLNITQNVPKNDDTYFLQNIYIFNVNDQLQFLANYDPRSSITDQIITYQVLCQATNETFPYDTKCGCLSNEENAFITVYPNLENDTAGTVAEIKSPGSDA